MIRDFDTAKKQLTELADVINRFKSDAVQLRLVELLLGAPSDASEETGGADERVAKSKPRRQKAGKKAAPATGEDKTAPKKKVATGNGGPALLRQAYEDGFFKQGRTLNDICDHFKNSKARIIKSNEISGKIARMVRSGELTRAKNKDNQYVYTKA